MSEQAKLTYSQYVQKYTTEHYDTIKVLVAKDRNIKNRVKAAARIDGLSVNAWMVKAIEKELEWYE